MQNSQETRLGPFILGNMESILSAWEDYARRYWKGPMPDVKTLRNDAQVMLRAVVGDMATTQTPAQRKTKSEGAETDLDSPISSAALGHALARIRDGFDIERMIAEFRALRASVVRIWSDSNPIPYGGQIADMDRFHEAIDQLVAVSVSGFTGRVEQSRRLFLGILGHDLRQPLSSLRMVAAILKENPALPDETRHDLLGRVDRSCASMGTMISDLLDFTTTQLGSAMPVTPAATRLETLCAEVIGEVRASAPGHTFPLETEGDATGEWDAARLRQLLSNLLMNAVSHGTPGQPVTTTVRGTPGQVTLSVHNTGKPIPPESFGILFNPMVRATEMDENRPAGSIGLGLYICRQIVQAHGGVIHVDSSAENGTTFTVTLPKDFTPQEHSDT